MDNMMNALERGFECILFPRVYDLLQLGESFCSKKCQAVGKSMEPIVNNLIRVFIDDILRKYGTVIRKDQIERDIMNLYRELQIRLAFKGDHALSACKRAMESLDELICF